MAIALVGSTTARAGTSNGFTSAAFDTTGANFIIVSYTAGDAVSQTVSDSKSNTWTALTASVVNRQQRFYYAYNATVGTGHTFTISGTGNFPDLCIAWYSGVQSASDPIDQQAVNGGLGGSFTVGPITPTVNGCLVASGMRHGDSGGTKTVASPLTLLLVDNDGSFGADIGAYADFIQTTAAAVQADWANTNAMLFESTIASFKPAAAAASIPWAPRQQTTTSPTPFHQWVQRAAQVIVGTAANPLPSPLDVWAQQAQHTAFYTDRRQYPQQRSLVSDPNLLVAPAFNPTLGGLNANYKPGNWPDPNRADWQQKSLVSDPRLLTTALLENELLGDADVRNRQRLQPATHVDRRQVPQQRNYVSDPNLLLTALLEGPLVTGILPAYKWATWPDGNRADWQQKPLQSDPALLLTALLEDALLGIHPKDVWRRDWYFYPWIPRDLRNAILVGSAANPLPSPLDAWQQMPPHLQAALYVDRRVAGQQRTLVSDPLLITPPGNVDPTQTGYLPQRYWAWRRDPYWTPPGAPGKDPAPLTTALLEDALLGRADNDRHAWFRRDPYWTPPGPPGKDPAPLLTALLEDVLLFAGAPRTPWRRDPYWVRQTFTVDPNEFPPGTPFDPTLAGLDWRRLHALFGVRPASAAYWQRVLLNPALAANLTKLAGLSTIAERAGLSTITQTGTARTGLSTIAERAGNSTINE